jgi:hypothetical protein
MNRQAKAIEATPDLLRLCQIANEYNQLQSKRHTARHRLRKLKVNLKHKSSPTAIMPREVTVKMQKLSLTELKYLIKKQTIELKVAEIACHDHVRLFSSELRELKSRTYFKSNYDHSCFIYFYKDDTYINRFDIADLALTKEIEDVISS